MSTPFLTWLSCDSRALATSMASCIGQTINGRGVERTPAAVFLPLFANLMTFPGSSRTRSCIRPSKSHCPAFVTCSKNANFSAEIAPKLATVRYNSPHVESKSSAPGCPWRRGTTSCRPIRPQFRLRNRRAPGPAPGNRLGDLGLNNRCPPAGAAARGLASGLASGLSSHPAAARIGPPGQTCANSSVAIAKDCPEFATKVA